jgi:lysozyme family protein
MPPPLALLVFDAAVNNGVSQAKHLLQQALGVTVDGVIGPQTEAALSAAMKSDVSALCAEFQARRVVFMSGLTLWYRDGLGWARRLTSLPYKGATITP